MGRSPCCASEPCLHAIARIAQADCEAYERPTVAAIFNKATPAHEYCMIGAAMHAALPAALPRFRPHGVIVSLQRIAQGFGGDPKPGMLRKGEHQSTLSCPQPGALPGQVRGTSIVYQGRPKVGRDSEARTGGSGWWTADDYGGLRPGEPLGASGMARERAAREAKPRFHMDATIILNRAHRLMFEPTAERSSLTAARSNDTNCKRAHPVLPEPRFVATATTSLPLRLAPRGGRSCGAFAGGSQ
jgi:hypothetical protein